MAILLSAAFPALADNHTNSEERWEKSKQSADQFWKNFKHDSKRSWRDSKSAFRDGWIEGKLEMAFITNKHLNPFDIDIDVNNYVATLSGQVSSPVDVELAQAIAIGIEGIDSVNNQLTVKKSSKTAKADSSQSKHRGFVGYLNDVSLLADVKTDLMSSSTIDGMDINVDVYNATVTLNGKVKSEAEKNLAEQIVRNNRDTNIVINNLNVIKSETDS